MLAISPHRAPFFLALTWFYICTYLHESNPVCSLMAKTFSLGSAMNNSNCSAHSLFIPFVPLPAGIWCPTTIIFTLHPCQHVPPPRPPSPQWHIPLYASGHVTRQLCTRFLSHHLDSDDARFSRTYVQVQKKQRHPRKRLKRSINNHIHACH